MVTMVTFDKYYMPLVEIHCLNTLTEYEPFSDQPVKSNKKRMKGSLRCQELMTKQRKIH